MRRVMLAGAVLAMGMTGGADAQQRVIVRGPGMGAPGPATPGMAPRTGFTGRWGSKVGGHWWGGVNAPGGWGAYRRPARGWTLPSYWYAPRFYVSDWSTYGLAQPPQGYTWVRYYDDAVLVDGRGAVYDSVGGLDWDRYEAGYAAQDAAYAEGAPSDGYYERDYDRRVDRRSSGVGGAVAGAVVGGVAGNVIAGRGNRLGGTLIGAGAGAAAGYAIDRSQDRHRVDDYGAPYGRPGRIPVAPDYPPPPPGDYAPPPPRGHAPYAPPPPVAYAPHAPIVQPLPSPAWRSADGTTTVTTTTAGGYVSGGYYYPGASTTTVVVQTQPVVTTTTEVYEDAVTYTRRPVAHIKTKRVWRPAPRCACR
jgi:Ni/Co efflux regulator RcnB